MRRGAAESSMDPARSQLCGFEYRRKPCWIIAIRRRRHRSRPESGLGHKRTTSRKTASLLVSTLGCTAHHPFCEYFSQSTGKYLLDSTKARRTAHFHAHTRAHACGHARDTPWQFICHCLFLFFLVVVVAVTHRRRRRRRCRHGRVRRNNMHHHKQ
jgi:hypothetical protein